MKEFNPQKLLIADVTNRLRDYSEFNLLFKDITFEEAWPDDEERLVVVRLIQSARFAASKDDFDYAIEKLGESQGVRDTLTAHYEKGRLYLRKGDVEKAIQEWQQLIVMDKGNKYADVRSCVSALMHAVGDRDGNKNMLQAFLSE